jgi:guanylate kinase
VIEKAMKRMIVILSGSSGVGKSTIINKLITESVGKYAFMTTVTTRPRRENEQENISYHFVSTDEFMNRVKDGEFYEYESVHGNLYGTSRIILNKLLEKNKVLLKDIDVFGTQNLVQKLKGIIKIITIFITADIDTLRNRLLDRGESLADIERRLSRFSVEQTFSEKYDYVVKNDNLITAVAEVNQIIKTEQLNK